MTAATAPTSTPTEVFPTAFFDNEDIALRVHVWVDHLNAIATGTDRFYVEARHGSKTLRVVTTDDQEFGTSIHAFVGADGAIYKSAGWKAPAAGVRYRVTSDADMDILTNIPAGANTRYLYR